jgi:hypothetical protein
MIHLQGMAFVVEENKASDPGDVALLGAIGIALQANEVTDLFEQFIGFRCANE